MSPPRPTAGTYDAEATRRFGIGFALGLMPLTALAGQYLIVYALAPANPATTLSLPFLQFVLLSLGSTTAGLAVVRLATRRGALAVAYLLIQLTEAVILIALLAGVGALRLHPSAMPTGAIGGLPGSHPRAGSRGLRRCLERRSGGISVFAR